VFVPVQGTQGSLILKANLIITGTQQNIARTMLDWGIGIEKRDRTSRGSKNRKSSSRKGSRKTGGKKRSKERDRDRDGDGKGKEKEKENEGEGSDDEGLGSGTHISGLLVGSGPTSTTPRSHSLDEMETTSLASPPLSPRSNSTNTLMATLSTSGPAQLSPITSPRTKYYFTPLSSSPSSSPPLERKRNINTSARRKFKDTQKKAFYQTHTWETPLIIAIRKSYPDIVHILLEGGSDVKYVFFYLKKNGRETMKEKRGKLMHIVHPKQHQVMYAQRTASHLLNWLYVRAKMGLVVKLWASSLNTVLM
jgi:hypothetical protein